MSINNRYGVDLSDSGVPYWLGMEYGNGTPEQTSAGIKFVL